jgi:16S rRNA (cytosine1402-N4)-methyltransferase
MTLDRVDGRMAQDAAHIPVMASEVKELLGLKPGSTMVDGTLGLGGHAAVLAQVIGNDGTLIGIDQDRDAIEQARERLKDFGGKLHIVKNNFSKLAEVLAGLGVHYVDAFLFDLGVSSLQLAAAERGFSFRVAGPLDMRMDRDAQVSAFELVNSLSEDEITKILWRYGEERFSRRIAKAIVRARAAQSIETTTELADIVLGALPYRVSRDGVHPATRSFQALRIAVNRELDVLPVALDAAFNHLKIGGRICVIAFHSLEDRIVKQKFRSLAQAGCAELLTKKPLRPGDQEARSNPRSRSARLRALERIA